MRLHEFDEKTYQVSYRIADKVTQGGTYQERYDDITNRLRAMNVVSEPDGLGDLGHVATSTWVVKSGEALAKDVLTRLTGLLTPGDDILVVTEIVHHNTAGL